MQPVAHPHPLGWKAECHETLRLAGPLALANLLQMLTYSVDVMFIARPGWGRNACPGSGAGAATTEAGALSGRLRRCTAFGK